MSAKAACVDLSPMNALNWHDSTGVSLLSRPKRRMNEFDVKQVNVKDFNVSQCKASEFKANDFNVNRVKANQLNETKMNAINIHLMTNRSGLANRSLARSAMNINKLPQQNEPNKPTKRSDVCSTCGMPLVARFATKGKHCARCLTDAQATARLPNGQTMNSRSVNRLVKGQVNGQLKAQVNGQVKSQVNSQVNGQSKNDQKSPIEKSPIEKSPIDRIEKPRKKVRKSKKLIKQQSNQIHQQSSHIIQRSASSILATVDATNDIHRDPVVSGQEKASKLASRPEESRSNEDSRPNEDIKPDSRSNKPIGNREALAKIRSNPIEVVSSQPNGDQTKVQSRFSWKKYLKETNSLAAPLKCFKPNQTFNNKPNYFKAGMKLEAIDPNHPSLFCVASVVEVCGFRMRIHLDEYSSQFDFWVNCDSPFIFPVGFCASTDRQLQPPRNHKQFDWSTYLQQQKAKAAPRHCFYWYNRSTDTPAGFRVGMKLEAVDKSNVSAFSVCVATIADLLGDWLLIHFDGWPALYDYWTRYDSPYLHPINWCKKQKNVQLTPPPNDQPATEFDWPSYLKRTESSAVISNLFRCRSQNSFKCGMKVEAVDPRNPRYVRVATVASRTAFEVLLHFDQFDPRFDVWLSDSSPDLHPVGWCLQANINLEPPPSDQSASSKCPSSKCPSSKCPSSKCSSSKCPTPTCNGIGHLRDPNELEHCTAADCPYALENADYELPDRLEAVNGFGSSSASSHSAMEASDSSNDSTSSRSTLGPHTVENSPLLFDSANCVIADLVKELNSFVDTLSPAEVLGWNCEKVSDLISILPRCVDLSARFLEERLDGQSFLLLTYSDLINILGIQRYQASMIYYNVICQLRKNLLK